VPGARDGDGVLAQSGAGGDDVGMEGSGQTGETTDRHRARSRVGLAVGVVSACAVEAAAVSGPAAHVVGVLVPRDADKCLRAVFASFTSQSSSDGSAQKQRQSGLADGRTAATHVCQSAALSLGPVPRRIIVPRTTAALCRVPVRDLSRHVQSTDRPRCWNSGDKRARRHEPSRASTRQHPSACDPHRGRAVATSGARRLARRRAQLPISGVDRACLPR
jgi:hypothetical protein